MRYQGSEALDMETAERRATGTRKRARSVPRSPSSLAAASTLSPARASPQSSSPAREGGSGDLDGPHHPRRVQGRPHHRLGVAPPGQRHAAFPDRGGRVVQRRPPGRALDVLSSASRIDRSPTQNYSMVLSDSYDVLDLSATDATAAGSASTTVDESSAQTDSASGTPPRLMVKLRRQLGRRTRPRTRRRLFPVTSRDGNNRPQAEGSPRGLV